VVTDTDGLNAILAGATLMDIGYSKVSVLDGGMAAWRQAGIPAETGLTGVIDSPDDVVLSGPDRSYADMMNYLRWEEELGKKYETTTKE
jgi:3-mercaptopyruvate sulfurtransferase SseA